jgi:hypothetical protein
MSGSRRSVIFRPSSLVCVLWSRQIGKADDDKPASIPTKHLVRFHASAGAASIVLPPLFVVWENHSRYVKGGEGM